MSRVSVTSLRRQKEAGERIAVLTAYDASFATLAEQAGVEVLLVGDSLGTVVQGHQTTVPVTLEQMVYHSSLVSRAARQALVVADLPFLSYCNEEQALESAAALMQQGGVQMVKLEGGDEVVDIVARLSAAGIPVCGHLGLLPQSVNKLGGYRIQGKEPHQAEAMIEAAVALEDAGAEMLVVECIPELLAREISRQVAIPVIGIGAGSGCDGQVLVLYDMLGITPGHRPSFVRDFLGGENGGVTAALAAYVRAVKDGSFPAS